MKKEYRIEIASNARKVARRYQRRMWWVDGEDLEQEAWLAQLTALRTYDPQEGGFGGYAWRAALYACQRFVLQASAPVSAQHDPTELIGLFREALINDEHVAPESVEEVLDEARLAHRVRMRLQELLGAEVLAFALAMLSKEYAARDVAADHGVPVQRVYKEVRAIRDKVAGDRVLFDLWRADNG